MTSLGEEITREEAMKALLTDKELSDLELVGTDEVVVTASRCMLAARSPVFRTMLFGEFAEAKSSTIRLSYAGDVLQAVVEYIYTNDCHVLHQDCCVPQTLVALVDAAQYFGLLKLSLQAQRAARSWMEKKPPLACLFLVESQQHLTGLQEWCRQLIRSKPSETFLEDDDQEAVAALCPSLLETILKDDKVEADEFTLFRILKAWADMDDFSIENDEADDLSTVTPETRREIASKFTQFIHLEGIEPPQLATTVASSGLVSPEQLCQAFQAQALRAHSEHAVSYVKPRYIPPVWESSQRAVLTSRSVASEVEILQCPEIKCGTHKWAIQIETLSGSMALGVASTIFPPDPEEALGCDGGGWALWQSGEICHGLSGDEVDLNFGEGSTVSLILDLREESGGTFSASVDDGPVVLLFSDMCSHLKGSIGGFVPALSMYAQGRIRLLGMHEVASD